MSLLNRAFGFRQEIRTVSFKHLKFFHFAVANTTALASLKKATTSLRLLGVAIKNKNDPFQNRRSERLQLCVFGVV